MSSIDRKAAYLDLRSDTLAESLVAAEDQCMAAEDCVARLLDEDKLTTSGREIAEQHLAYQWGEYNPEDYENAQNFLDEQRSSQ